MCSQTAFTSACSGFCYRALILDDERVGVWRMLRTKAGVLDAIRSGRTLAVDPDGRLTGDSSLIELLGDVRPAGRLDSDPMWRRLSMVLSWLGAAGLLIVGRRRSESRV